MISETLVNKKTNKIKWYEFRLLRKLVNFYKRANKKLINTLAKTHKKLKIKLNNLWLEKITTKAWKDQRLNLITWTS